MAKKGVKRPLQVTPVSVIEVNRANVPDYLKRGEFYLALGEEDDNVESLVIPSDTMKENTSIANSDDLIYLLKSVRFWGVDGIIPQVVDFITSNPDTARLKSSLAKFERDYPYLFTLRKIVGNQHQEKLNLVLELGDLELLKYFLSKQRTQTSTLTNHSQPQNGARFTTFSAMPDCAYMTIAAQNGHFNCLVYLHEQGFQWGTDIVRSAIFGGNIECMKYIHQHELNFIKLSLASKYYITNKNIDCYIYCYQNSDRFDGVSFGKTLLREGLKAFKYCVSQGIVPDISMMWSAADAGLFECVKYLHALGCPWDANICSVAASNRNLPLLKYLHEHGCLWDSRTTTAAAQRSSLPCLKYAHTHGCPWNETAYYNLTSEYSCYKYLEEHGCPKPEEDYSTL